MSNLMSDAAWVLTACFLLSILYELFRATIRSGVSEHDSMRAFVAQLPLYLSAGAVIVMLFIGEDWAAWIGLVFCVGVALVSVFYYNPRIMIDRRPGLVDWFEDLVFTGLLFVAATQLIYELGGR